MDQANRGTKRRCTNCGAPYYDLNRDPVVCPKCETPYQPRPAAPLRAFRGPVRIAKTRPVEVPKTEEAEDPEAFAEDEVMPAQEDDEESITPLDDEEG